ncbi:helix-hairpin-helix domain-containing protein [Mesobacillus harenae]|uniref:helix-hairpin-helix domain-containing protein n=1 Tax=Mesobacillus harenae TaxID=2213203 RepID=UPI001580005C|nr:helix-hairpin-helix domain-containing protein [Mesobacillus harenae]
MIEKIKEHRLQVLISVSAVLMAGYFLFSVIFPADMSDEAAWDPVEEVDGGSEDKSLADEQLIIMADIKGAVVKPGVYEMKEGERVVDLITAAGGVTEDAEVSGINFAVRITDEMIIYIPRVGEENPAGELADSGSKQGKVNLNKANASELETLPGIGPSKSAAIIEYRETNGSFKNIEELMEITGIGDKTFEKLQEHITVQ